MTPAEEAHTWDMARWVVESEIYNEPWMVLFVNDVGEWLMFGMHYKRITGRFHEANYYPFQGIHCRNIRVYVNYDIQPKYIKLQISSLILGNGSKMFPYPIEPKVDSQR